MQIKLWLDALLYQLELALAPADDLPWIDTLDFFWDSLPDSHLVRAVKLRHAGFITSGIEFSCGT